MEPIDMDPNNTNIITFKMDDFKTHLSHQLAFHLTTKIIGKSIHRSVLDEGPYTLVMSLYCWRSIGSPEINHSPTTLKAFDGRRFQPYGLLPAIHIELWGNQTPSMSNSLILLWTTNYS